MSLIKHVKSLSNMAVFDILIIVMATVGLIFHGVGFYLLLCLNSIKSNESQTIFLLNLSFCELLHLVLALVSTLLVKFASYVREGFYLYCINSTAAATAYYLLMIFMTLDRFFELYLNVKYPVYWSVGSTKILMAAIWCISTVIGIIFIILHHYNLVQFMVVTALYMFPPMSLLFLLIAGVTYGYIITKLIIANRHRSSVSSEHTNNSSKNKRRIRFSTLLLPSLLIGTFFIFMVVPDMLWFFHALKIIPVTNTQGATLVLLYLTGYICDATIYIFLKPSARRLLLRKLKLQKNPIMNGSINSHTRLKTTTT